MALPLPMGGALPAPAERLGALAAVIQPDLEALQAREIGGEQARGLAERVMASVIGGTQELPLLAPEAPAAEPLTEKNIMAVLRLLSQKQRGGYELLGQTGLTPEGLRRVIERIDAMGMLFIHGSLQPRDIGSAQVSLKPSASGAAALISQPWPGTDTLSSRALDALALLQTKVRFGYELMSALEMDRPRLENLFAELLNAGLIHLSGDFRGPGVDNTLVSILPSNVGKVKAVLERKRLLKLLLPPGAAPALFRAPKIAVTPVSEHLPGVFFVKFLRATTLEVMLGVLARNGVKPELYADNGDGFRVRVALPEREAAEAAGRLAAEGQVEDVEVNRAVHDILRRGGAGGMFSAKAPSAAEAALPVDGRAAKRLHDAYKDWGEGLGGLAGVLLALGVGAWAFAAASASLALAVALFWGAVAALAVGMLTTLGLASLGRDIGARLGQEKVDRIHLDFLDLHRGRIEAVPGVASVRYQISIPGLSDAVTPADGPLFVVVLDGRVAYETVHRDLKAAVPELAGFPVFFERGDKR